jgi:hypothetical protein
MKLQPIIGGLVIGGIGFALNYYNIVENQYIYYGALGGCFINNFRIFNE